MVVTPGREVRRNVIAIGLRNHAKLVVMMQWREENNTLAAEVARCDVGMIQFRQTERCNGQNT